MPLPRRDSSPAKAHTPAAGQDDLLDALLMAVFAFTIGGLRHRPLRQPRFLASSQHRSFGLMPVASRFSARSLLSGKNIDLMRHWSLHKS